MEGIVHARAFVTAGARELPMAVARWVFLIWLVPALVWGDDGSPFDFRVGSEFAATDTLECGEEDSQDAQECIANLSWPKTKFTVHLEAPEPGRGTYLVRFPSARPIGNSKNDLVSMEWYDARDPNNEICRAPAVVVVHESGRGMTVGRLIARGLNGQGLHAFLLHMPGYGARRVEGPQKLDQLIPSLRQAIADVRRARDAVAALPVVDPSVVGVQGTSLGGFVTATVAGLDNGYDRVFILLAGGNLHDVVLNGSKDAAKTKEKLLAAGVTEEQIKEHARHIEPLRLAHRIRADQTWLYSGKYDDVVPPRCSLALAKAAKLPEGHHIELAADHYSGIIFLPYVLQQIHDHMTERPAVDRGEKN
jgi:dienelactone hydrolase